MAGPLAVLRHRFGALPTLAVDVSIAVLCYLATVAVPWKLASTSTHLYALGAVASLPLVWRRRFPVLVALAVGAGSVGLGVTRLMFTIPLPYGQLVATYTIAALAAPVWRLCCVVCTGAGVLIITLVVMGSGPTALATAALPFVVAYALGTGVRARRDRIAMLEERTRRLAEEERERIARELHDIVAHSVSVIVVQAEAGQVLAADPAKVTATFEAISATGREAMAQLARALDVLRGRTGERAPQPGIADLPTLIGHARLAGLTADVTSSGSPVPLPADLGTAVYRLVQEALTNTIKHACATRVDTALDWLPGTLRLTVTDDGRGPTDRWPDRDPAGLGLIGMRERVEAFGGTLRTGPGPTGGFRVTAELPRGSWGRRDG